MLLNPEKKLSVIIDTDMAKDDIMSICYLLNLDSINVKAITVNGVGEANLCDAGQNALNLLKVLNREEIIVAKGRNKPFQGGYQFPSIFKSEANRFYGINLVKSNDICSRHTASEVIENIFDDAINAGEEVLIICLGSLTNIAQILNSAPRILVGNRLKLFVSGGAVKVPGNIKKIVSSIDNKVSEWNMFVDSLAAKQVIESGIDIMFVPLDITNKIEITRGFLDELKLHYPSPTSNAFNITYRLLEYSLDEISGKEIYYWDLLTSICASTSNIIAEIQSTKITVQTGDIESAGQFLEDPNGVEIRYVSEINRTAMETDMLNTLLKSYYKY